MTPDQFRRWIALGLSVLGLIAFAIIYALVAIKGAGFVSKYPNIEYVGTALAGLVGGFVAAAFGQKLPAANRQVPAAAGLSPAPQPSRFRAAAHRLGDIPHAAAPQPPAAGAPISVTEWIGVLYIIVYFAVGIMAAIVWIFSPNPPGPTEMIKNLAMIVLGLIIAIIGSTLRN